jgi:alginate O-acetyltransferase complex protein AlgI
VRPHGKKSAISQYLGRRKNVLAQITLIMSFASIDFLVFISLFFILWPLFKKRPLYKLIYILLASLVFYGWADIRNIIFLSIISLFTFLWGKIIIQSSRGRNLILTIGLAIILAILVAYRYPILLGFSLNLFRGQVEQGTEWMTVGGRYFPLGISFITLHCIGFLFDCKREMIRSPLKFIPFMAYLSFFPKLIAGPIERYDELVPQLLKNGSIDDQALWTGFKLIVYGYFYKTVVGDHLATYVGDAFGSDTVLHQSLYWWAIITAFAMQIYFDFRGYTNIARGLGNWMGISLRENFSHPYLSSSVGDFWNRWHISFSNWLRDYIFFPIARSNTLLGNPYIAVWITMAFSGMWHGTGWTFLAWGLVMAFYISIERATNWPKRLSLNPFGRFFSRCVTLFQIWIAWVFFRSRDLAQALQIFKAQFAFPQQATSALPYQFWAFLLLAIGLESLQASGIMNRLRTNSATSKMIEATLLTLVLVGIVLFRGAENEFVYFQF